MKEPGNPGMGWVGFDSAAAFGLTAVAEVTGALRDAFAADYVLLGGGNAKHVDPLPPRTRRGASDGAFKGGFRLWEEMIEPHDRRPPLVWRVVR